MSETFLNGKITVTALAAPTPEDIEKLDALSKEERVTLLREAIEHGENSGISDRGIDEIFEDARRRAPPPPIETE